MKTKARRHMGTKARRTRVPAFCVSTFLCFCVSAFAESGGGYNIKKSTIDGGGTTFHAGGGYRLGGTVGQHDTGNHAGGEYRLTSGFWSPIPAPGNIGWDAGLLSADRTTRSLRFKLTALPTTNVTAVESAIEVTMVDLQHPIPQNLLQFPPPDFSAYESGTCSAPGEAGGCARWVGKPGTFLESQDLPLGVANRAARLQCTPFYWDWVTETASGSIAVVGAEIVPSSEYSVQAYAASCKGAETGCTNVSLAVTMYTRRSGDTGPNFNPPATSTQPDALDVAAVVTKLKNLPGALVKSITQLQPNLPELNADINALDIVAVVDAVKQKAYAFGGPCPCPSTVPCPPAAGSVACTSPTPCVTAFGPGSLCVKTCSGGDNAGDPCINDTHCPGGGICESGHCRDRCGRCMP